jgi:hypothetical protein
MTGWHRSHTRKALAAAAGPFTQAEDTAVRPGGCGRVGVLLGGARRPTGKRLVPIMGELAPRLRRLDELQVTAAVLLVGMSRRRWTVGSLPIGPRCSFADAATPSRVRCRSPRSRSGRRGCRSGCATRADWDDAAPGFVEIDLVGHRAATLGGITVTRGRSPISRPAGRRTVRSATRPAGGSSRSWSASR